VRKKHKYKYARFGYINIYLDELNEIELLLKKNFTKCEIDVVMNILIV